jgi:DNA-binding transcriptional MerR regulator
MAPAKSRSKQRLYRKRDIEVIDLIRRLLYEERYTIAGARRRLRELGLARALEGGESEAATDGAAALGAQRAVALAPAPSPAASATPANVVPLAPGFAAASVESAGPGAGAAGGDAVGRSGAPQREDTAAVRDALRRIRDELVALRAAL